MSWWRGSPFCIVAPSACSSEDVAQWASARLLSHSLIPEPCPGCIATYETVNKGEMCWERVVSAEEAGRAGQVPGPALPWLSLPLEAGVQAASGPRGMPPEEPSSQVWVRKPRAGSDLRALGQHSSRPRPACFRYSPPICDLGFR